MLPELGLGTVTTVVLYTCLGIFLMSIVGLVAAYKRVKLLYLLFVIMIFIVILLQFAMGRYRTEPACRADTHADLFSSRCLSACLPVASFRFVWLQYAKTHVLPNSRLFLFILFVFFLCFHSSFLSFPLRLSFFSLSLSFRIVPAGVMRALNVDLVAETFREDSDAGHLRRVNFQNTLSCCGWDFSTQEFFPERIACYALHPTFTTTCLGAVHNFIDTYVIPASSVVFVSGGVNLGSLIVALLVIWSFVGGKEDFFDNAFFDN